MTYGSGSDAVILDARRQDGVSLATLSPVPPSDVTLAFHDSAEAADLVDDLCDAYADAYGAVPGEKSSAFRERALRTMQAANYSLVTAHVGGQLVEIEVRRARQGQGIGRRLHDAFMSGRSEERATPASNPEATGTHALYERWAGKRWVPCPPSQAPTTRSTCGSSDRCRARTVEGHALVELAHRLGPCSWRQSGAQAAKPLQGSLERLGMQLPADTPA